MNSANILLTLILQVTSPGGVAANTIVDTEEALCLAQNIFHEAKSESISGQVAVASVTLNRANDSRFPNTICGVVKQSLRTPTKHICAFSWYCKKKVNIAKVDNLDPKVFKQLKTAATISVSVLNGKTPDNTNGATYFYNPADGLPGWVKSMRHTARIGNHTFMAPRG